MNVTTNIPAQAKIFNRAFDAVSKELKFEQMWKNGTGYLDGIVQAIVPGLIKIGDFAKFTDDKGRKALVVKSRLGNVVVFQRYANDTIFVANGPGHGIFNALLGGGAIGVSGMETFVGNCADMEDNIAVTLENAYRAMKRMDKETADA